MEKKKQRTLAIFALAIALVATTVAYAVLQTTLNISGSVTRKGGSWDVHLANVGNINNAPGVIVTTPSTTTNTLTFGATFKKPGDYLEFTFDIVNGSDTLNAVSSGSSMELKGGTAKDDCDVEELANGTCFNSELVTSQAMGVSSSDITCRLYDNATNALISRDWQGPITGLNLSAKTTKKLKLRCEYNNNVTDIEDSDVALKFNATFNFTQENA